MPKFNNPIPKEVFDKLKEDEETPSQPNRWFDDKTEILDMEAGWIYERLKRGRKGKKIRKFLVSLYGYDYRREGPFFWTPRLKDIAACEKSRWNAIQYAQKQYAKISGAFQLVLDNTPFCCIKMTREWPGFSWVVFPHYEDNGYHGGRGVSWSHWTPEDERRRNQNQEFDGDRPPLSHGPLKQDVGDAWFAYEKRSREIRERRGHFEYLFEKSVIERFSNEFYRDRYSQRKINLVINGRNYLIGKDERGNFGILAKPEDTSVLVIE